RVGHGPGERPDRARRAADAARRRARLGVGQRRPALDRGLHAAAVGLGPERHQAVSAVSAEHFARGDAGYEAARRATVANARCPERYPDLIVRASTVDHVVDAVRMADERGWKIGVR